MLKDLDKIIEGCIKKHRPSQEKLYRAYYNYAMTVAASHSNSDFEAEEIVNDGFIKIFGKIKEFDTQYPFTPWFRRIIVNSAIDHFRRNKKHQHHLEVEQAISLESEDISAIDQLSEDDLMSVIRSLPNAYRTVFVLYVLEGYKHHEIADQLGISEGTSKSNYARARQKLQVEISKRLNHG